MRVVSVEQVLGDGQHGPQLTPPGRLAGQQPLQQALLRLILILMMVLATPQHQQSGERARHMDYNVTDSR